MKDEPVTKVTIETPPLTVRVESTEDLDAVTTKAKALYRELHTPDMSRPSGAVGFHVEREPEVP